MDTPSCAPPTCTPRIDNIPAYRERGGVLPNRFLLRRALNLGAGLALSFSLTGGLTSAACAQEAAPDKPLAEDTEQLSDFLQFRQDEKRGRLETAIVRYANASGKTVDLIGAIHIADTAYFEALNKRMEGYDALLYEMVGDPEELKDPDKVAANQNPLRMMMRMVKGMLKLDYQLDAIDYTKKNFVHADLDMNAFTGLMAERGENIFTIVQNAMRKSAASGDVSTTSATPTPFDLAPLLSALASADSASALKLVVAEQIDKSDLLLDSAEAGEGTVILTERNKHVMKVIDEQIAEGNSKLGVFYGAAHLPDLERRLREAGYRKTASEWLTAWDIPKPEKPAVNAKEPATSPQE
ncbi:MAG: hypothetical protein R3F19_22980 [Verrucomicrobiales bacterium]